jgi:transposase
MELRTPQQVLAARRRARVRALVAAGTTVPGAADEVGISPSVAYRYLKGGSSSRW